MSNHNSLSFWAQSFFELSYINIVLRNCYINKNWNCTILQDWSYCCWETTGNCNNFITTLYLSFLQKRRCQSHECKKICRRTRVYKRNKRCSKIFAKLFFKLVSITSTCKPELKSRIC